MLYSTCASKRAGVNKTVCVTSMSEFIKVKSYARFKRLLPTRQAKSLASSYMVWHLAMLATCQMRRSHVARIQIRNPQRAATHFRKTGRYLCTFFFLCFSLPFFLTGVVDGVGDGVPENFGVGVGRTRG